MKVMFIIPSMAGGGAERVISVLANAFTEKGIETKIMMTAGDACDYELHSDIELFQAGEVTGGSVIKRFARVFRMRRLFKENSDAILVAFEPDATFFAGIAKMGLSMKLLASERNDPKSFGNSKVRKFAYRWADKLVFQTRDAMEYFAPEIQKKGCVIPNPISDSLPEPYTGQRKKTVVAVSRLEPQKNHKMMLQAFAEFVRKYPEYTLYLYGKGSLEGELRQLAVTLQIEDKVIFEGFRKDVMKEIREAGMFVLSSDYEGISNSLLEAMAVGLPVISTDCPCGGSRLCISHGVNGLLTPVGNAESLEKAMTQIASSEEEAVSMGQEAVKVREQFSSQSIVEQWIETLKELEK